MQVHSHTHIYIYQGYHGPAKQRFCKTWSAKQRPLQITLLSCLQLGFPLPPMPIYSTKVERAYIQKHFQVILRVWHNQY